MAVAVITGASSGIGREFAFKLRDMAGIDEFWLIARSTDRLCEVAQALSVKCKIISADLTKKEDIEKYREALREENPEIAFLVNAAGFGVFGAFDTLDEATVNDMIDLNIKASVLITHMSVPYMKKGGRIIELGSGSAFTPLPHFNVYASSKAFIVHYTKALNFELKPYSVKATCFCPGWVETAFLAKSLEAPGAYVPKKFYPVLNPEKIVKGCVKASVKGKRMYVTGKYTKMQHILYKLMPSALLSKIWLKMLRKNETKENR